MEFVFGSRWISQTESELGLGIVVGLEGRHVTIRFPAAEEDRVYATSQAPLARVVYQVGDNFDDAEQRQHTVLAVEEDGGLQFYLTRDEAGETTMVPETQISGFVRLSSPAQRLLSGHFDKAGEYALRVATLGHQDRCQQSPTRGLLGSRTQLLPHQVYIAHTVGTRYAPRVLLADEVGLGKTIEAGMILHQQLQTHRARRVLILVPDALLHQWLVEMLRKFSLRFALFDRERVDALLEEGETNPFEAEQLVLCGVDFLVEHADAADMVRDLDWDMVVVDEAHHLDWSPEQASPQYQLVEDLGQSSKGLLLLTATPEQLGMTGHFARLRLLDPARFADLDQFTAEQAGYQQINQIVEALTEESSLSAQQTDWLAARGVSAEGDKSAVIGELLDRHGTGRVLFRNTRSAVEGFPQRIVHPYPLQTEAGTQPVEDWLTHDPRVQWVTDFLQDMNRQNRDMKVLLICRSAKLAVDLEHHLHLKVGIRSAAFYEDLSIVERDRAAAYFGDTENGAQVLICSEIGSEGRNFQFAHHLILFDLPDHPDLLEQRIGRLDRIGQQHDVHIHVPYIEHSHQEALFRWYHEGMNAFVSSFSGGDAVYQEFAAQLTALESDGADLDELVEQTRLMTTRVRQELEQGRDRLLEINSCDPQAAAAVIADIEEAEEADTLFDYMADVFDVFGVDHEPHSEHSVVLTPTEHMLTPSFPGLGDEGSTITYDRATAALREDWQFVTWESPMVTGIMDLVLGGELGNTNLSAMKLKAIPAGTVLLEAWFTVSAIGPAHLQIDRFLPTTPVRIVTNGQGRSLGAAISHEQLNVLCKPVNKAARLAVVKEIRGEMERCIDAAKALADKELDGLRQAGHQRVNALLGQELERLTALRALNPSVREDELEFLQGQQDAVARMIEQSRLQMEALRVIIAT